MKKLSIVDNPLWIEYLSCCKQNGTKPSLWDFVHWNPPIETDPENKHIIRIMEWVK